MARLLRGADVVVTHTRFVASQVRLQTGRDDVTVLPLPIPVGLITAGAGAVVSPRAVTDTSGTALRQPPP